MSSVLEAIEQGYRGVARNHRVPAGLAEQPEGCGDPGRVIVRDGQFTSDATDEDRARLGPLVEHGVEVRYRESPGLRAWAADVAQRKHRPKKQYPARPRPSTGKPMGRPPKFAHLKPDVERLRAEGLSWREVGARLGIHPEAARMLVVSRKREIDPAC